MVQGAGAAGCGLGGVAPVALTLPTPPSHAPSCTPTPPRTHTHTCTPSPPTPPPLQDVSNYNFDNPDAFDQDAILACLTTLQQLQPADVPIYDFSTHQRSAETRRVLPADVVVIEGILVLHMEKIRGMLNMKIFVDTDDDVRLARR